ncbi:MAG TPA: hypothetical protein VF613_04280 [Longimicrobium sp.]
MLGLSLRAEFQGKRLQGTAIELANDKGVGATQIPAQDFLRITYPSLDLLKAIEAVGPSQGRPVVLIGERGQGKSHLMAALYHALTDSHTTRSWLTHWSGTLSMPKLAELPLRDDMHVISESLHRQRYKHLWDLLFEKHPFGPHARGKWEGMGTDVPSDQVLLEMFTKQPTALILDEYQTWFDGLTNTKQHPWRNWAFNFVQLLSEIAKENPDKLVLVVSVRNGNSDAYQQLHRVGPVLVDFKGPNADRERRRLLLHRLFDNRLQVDDAAIEATISAHVSEYFRLHEVPPAEHDRKRMEFRQAWPFAPHLLQLLEDQVLVATDAQETRDLIRILANLYKNAGEKAPLLTAADFRLDGPDSGIMALLDSVSNQHHATLREKAQRNLDAVKEAVHDPAATVPHVSEVIGALWLRSLAAGNVAGADRGTLQLDVTRGKPVDDNAFQVELSAIVDNSFNIHQAGGRLVFREEENPEAKLKATARNDKLFADGGDRLHLAQQVRYVLGGAGDTAQHFRIVVLRETWHGDDPWSALELGDHPDQWDAKIPVLVLPEQPDKLDARLGVFLAKRLTKRRNTVRFLLPRAGLPNLFLDRDLLLLARMALKAAEWMKQSADYKPLQQKYEKELRTALRTRFDRYAILETWSFMEPTQCVFRVEALGEQGEKIPEAMDRHIRDNVFIPEDFRDFVLAAAANNDSVGKVLRELQEPRPNGHECIPWLGETAAQERVLRLCAQGKIGIDWRGQKYLQAQPGEAEQDAWNRIRGNIATGKHLDEVVLHLPQAAPQTGGTVTPPVQTPVQPVIPGFEPVAPPAVVAVAGGGGGATVLFPPIQPGLGSSLFEKPLSNGQKRHSVPATSPLNLLSRVENLGVNAGTPVRDVSIRIDALSGAQLQKLIKALPDGVTYALDLATEEA